MTRLLARFSAGLLVATALLAVGPASAEEAATTTVPASAPVIGAAVSTFKLPNGLTVVVIPDRRAPVVTHMVWYRAGSADEPAGKSGIAHYLEHLMFKGTKANPGGIFSKKVAEIGGQENAFTSWDYTAYYQRVAKEHLGLVMGLEADRMQNLALDAATAAPELKVVLEERSMRVDNDPSARLSEALDAALHPNHPYRIPIIGWRDEIEQLTVDDAKAFYDRYYTPNNAILVVAGDVDEATVRDLALTHYGRVARRAEPGDRARPQDPESVVSRFVALADERVSQPSWRRVYAVPSGRKAPAGESEALDLFADVLGGGSTSLLYRKLVVEKGLAAQVAAYHQGDALDDGKFAVYAVPRDGVALADLGKAVDAVVAEAIADGPSEAELTRSKTKVLAESIRVQDSQAALARLFGEELAVGGSVERVRTWPARIRAVTAAEVKAAAALRLKPEAAVTAELRTAPATGKAVAPKPAAWPTGGPIR
ncbi:MAG: pitrilysin family protein [Siculibacillus sp.]